MFLPVADAQQEAPSLFIQETLDIIRRIRRAFQSIFNGVPGGIRNSYDGHRYFGVDTKLSWQLFKIAAAEDDLALPSYLPAPASMQKLLKAAHEKGIAREDIQSLETAYAEFERLVETHAGDRTRFNSMVRGVGGDLDDPQSDLRHRKAVYAGHSHFWGVEIDTFTVTFIIRSGSQPGSYDYAHIRSKSGVCRLRADSDIVLDTLKMTDTRGGTDHLKRSAIDSGIDNDNISGVISHFSSQPLPRLITELLPDGRTITRLAGDAVGMKNLVNVAFGHIWRNAPISPWLDTNRDGFGTAVKIPYPTKLLIVDVLAHKNTFPKLEQHSEVYGHASIDGDVGEIMRRQMKLPFRERISKYRCNKQMNAIPEVPEYSELIRYCFEQTNWSLDEFDLYRLRIEYPLMDTLVTAWFHTPGPEKPSYTEDWQI